jgi:phosphatidylglycerol:prolipoprotein diacylglycerol transferase
MAAGFAVGAWWLVRRGRAKGLAANRLIDLTIVMVISGLLGGRLLYAMVHWNQFYVNPWRVFWPVQADGTLGLQGFVYYGGIMLAIPVAALLVRRWQLPPLKVLDAGAPALALGTAIGRLGCFLNGCCFGRPTQGPFGVVFPEGSQAGNLFTGTAIHPTQLYIVADNLIIVGVLLVLERKWARFDGLVIGTYLMLTGLTRSYEDLFRYYESSMRLFDLGGLSITVNHLLGAVLMIAGGLLIARSRSRTPDTQV